jgi:hypothetical protein
MPHEKRYLFYVLYFLSVDLYSFKIWFNYIKVKYKFKDVYNDWLVYVLRRLENRINNYWYAENLNPLFIYKHHIVDFFNGVLFVLYRRT